MSVIKISELVDVINLNKEDTFPIVSEGATRKATIQQLIDTVGKNISVLNVQKVSSVSEVINENTLYLIPNSQTGSNIYDEYILIDNKPEMIASQSVDLSGYSTTTEVQSMINTAIGDVLNGSY